MKKAINDNLSAEQLKCYIELSTEAHGGLWVQSSGLSMLPVFYRGVEVHIRPLHEPIEKGDVVVFHRDNKFVAHRVIGFDKQNNHYHIKGDTLFFPDIPASKEEILGIVDFTRKKGKITPVVRDAALAKLSGSLGYLLVHRLGLIPDWLKFMLYFLFFSPAFLTLKMRRFFRKKDGKKTNNYYTICVSLKKDWHITNLSTEYLFVPPAEDIP